MLNIPVDDRGFTLGHGLFETILCVRGEFVWWEEHLDRLARGCPTLRLPAPDRTTCLNVAKAAWVDAGAPDRAAVRLNWSAGSGGRGLDLPGLLNPRLTASAAPAERAVSPVSMAVASTRRNEHSPASRLKTLAYLDNVLARAEAHDAHADEALMLNTAGNVACAAIGNVFWLTDDELHTPALDCGALDGMTRRRVLAIAQEQGLAIRVLHAPLSDLRDRPMFLTNSLVGVRTIASLDGRACPPSPIIQNLAQALALP